MTVSNGMKPDPELTAAVLQRIADEQFSDPASDDLTVPLAIENAEKDARLLAQAARIERLEAALRPFAALGADYPCPHEMRHEMAEVFVTIAQLRNAYAALNQDINEQ